MIGLFDNHIVAVINLLVRFFPFRAVTSARFAVNFEQRGRVAYYSNHLDKGKRLGRLCLSLKIAVTFLQDCVYTEGCD